MIWRPTVSTGFSDVIGSWKTMAMSRAAHLAHLLLGEPEEVLALEPDLAADDPAGRARRRGAGWRAR